MAPKRTTITSGGLVSRNEQGDVKPRIAGGVAFESHVAPVVRGGKGSKRGLHSAARAKNPIAAVMSEFMTPDGRVVYND